LCDVNVLLPAITAIAACVSSCIAYKQCISYREIEIFPALSLMQGHALVEDESGLPILLFLKNIGKGLANIESIESYSGNIIAINKGIPLTVAPGDYTEIKIWLKKSVPSIKDARLIINYSDFENRKYSTEMDLIINYPYKQFEPMPKDLFFVDKHKCIKHKRKT